MSFALVTTVSASYYNDKSFTKKITIQQPDNKVYSVYAVNLRGFKYLRSPNGNILVKNDKTGWYEIALFFEIDGKASLAITGRKYKPVNRTYLVKKDHMNVSIWESDLARIVDPINAEYERNQKTLSILGHDK